jgi:hypothetical protein
VEEISEGGEGHIAELGTDLREDHSVAVWATRRLESGRVERVLHASQGLGGLGSSDEGHNVGVVLLRQHLLGGARVVLDATSTDNLALPEVGELQLGCQRVPRFTRGVPEAQFVGVFVKFVELGDLGDNIEVSRSTLDSIQLLLVVL